MLSHCCNVLDAHLCTKYIKRNKARSGGGMWPSMGIQTPKKYLNLKLLDNIEGAMLWKKPTSKWIEKKTLIQTLVKTKIFSSNFCNDYDQRTMMAQWKVAYYTNLNTYASSPKPKITYVEIIIHVLITMEQNSNSWGCWSWWNKTRNHLC